MLSSITNSKTPYNIDDAMDTSPGFSSRRGSGGSVFQSRSRSRGRSRFPVVYRGGATPRTTRVGFVRYATKGHSGNKFGKPKRFKPDSYLRKGIVYKYETGSTTSVPNGATSVIGHSTSCPETQIQLVMCCIIKELFKQAGQQIESWDETPEFPTATYNIVFRAYLEDSATAWTAITGSAITNTTTFWAAATDLVTILKSTLSDSTQYKPRYVKVYLHESAGIGGKVGEILLNNFYLDFNSFSKLDLQNVTLAADAVNQDLMTDVTNNPLVGKCYYGNNTNGFFPMVRTTGDVSYTPFVSDPINGILLNDSVNSVPEYIAEPPSGDYFKKCSKVTGIHMSPGEIKSSNLGWQKRMSFQTFMYAYDFYTRLGTGTKLIFNHGTTKMYLIEKRLNNRAESTPIAIDWEINLTLKVKYSYKAETPITAMKTTIA